jgi:hypothetical protein
LRAKLLGIVGGMAIYWALVVVLGGPIATWRNPNPNLAGAAMFLLVLGPTAILTFVTVLVLAFRNKSLKWMWGVSAGIAAASLALVASC